MNIENKTILITGGATGLGLAFARALNKGGNTVIICGRRQQKLDEAVSSNEGLRAIRCDMTDDAQVEAMLAKIDSEHGGLDVVINNAGTYEGYGFLNTPDLVGKVEQDLSVNLMAPFKLAARVLPGLNARSGALINVSSGLAYVPFAAAPVYSASRAAIHYLSRNLRRLHEGDAVKIIEVLPPVMDTALVAGEKALEGQKKMAPAEVAAAALAAIAKGKEEIPIGGAKQLRFMGRMAPNFIEGAITKGT